MWIVKAKSSKACYSGSIGRGTGLFRVAVAPETVRGPQPDLIYSTQFPSLMQKIVKYGSYVEHITYEKWHQPNPPRPKSSNFVPNSRQFKPLSRTQSAIKRAKRDFNRLVLNNFDHNDTLFFTLTHSEDVTRQEAVRNLARFTERLRQAHGQSFRGLKYIAVFELTKKRRIHIHLFIRGIPRGIALGERRSRFLQSAWRKGFVDARLPNKGMAGLSQYLTKYFAKDFGGAPSGARLYNASRNCDYPSVISFDESLVQISTVAHGLKEQEVVYSIEMQTQYWGIIKKIIYKYEGKNNRFRG